MIAQTNSPNDTALRLRETQLLGDLEDTAFESLTSLIRWRDYREGTEIIPYKDEEQEVYFIASGSVRVTIFSILGKEISYEDLEAGEMFGELSAIDHLPRTANVIALEDSRIGTLSSADFWELIRRNPGFTEIVLKRLARMVRFLADRVYQYGALDVKDRIRVELLRLAHRFCEDQDSAIIEPFPTHSEIASRVNTHREAVTRELNELAKMGIIEQEKRVLKVTSIGQLEDLLPEDI